MASMKDERMPTSNLDEKLAIIGFAFSITIRGNQRLQNWIHNERQFARMHRGKYRASLSRSAFRRDFEEFT
jgi:hypothetical protein